MVRSAIPTAISSSQGGGGGGSGLSTGAGSGGSVPLDQVFAYVDLKVDKMKSDLKFEFHGELEPIKNRLDKVPGWAGHFAVIGAVFTALGIILAVLAFAGDRFNGGMSAAGALTQQKYDSDKRDDALNEKVDCLLLRQNDPKAKCR